MGAVDRVGWAVSERIPVTFETTTRNGYTWRKDAYKDYGEWDWANAWVDGGGTWVFGPGPYLKVPYCGADEWMEGTVSRIRPRSPTKAGEWNFERCNTDESPTGWVMARE